MDLDRAQHLAQRERVLGHPDRFVRAALEQRVVACLDPREQIGPREHVHERPRERGVEIRLRAHVDDHHVARHLHGALRGGCVGPRVPDLLQIVAGPSLLPLALGEDLADHRLDPAHGSPLDPLSGGGRE